jgi:hypothetical protein
VQTWWYFDNPQSLPSDLHQRLVFAVEMKGVSLKQVTILQKICHAPNVEKQENPGRKVKGARVFSSPARMPGTGPVWPGGAGSDFPKWRRGFSFKLSASLRFLESHMARFRTARPIF